METKKILDFIIKTVQDLVRVSSNVLEMINTPMNNILSKIGIKSELLQTILNTILETINIGNLTILDMVLGVGIPIIMVTAIIKYMNFSK